MVRVLVVADDRDVRQGLGRLFAAAGQAEVMFSATDEPCAGAFLPPDLVVIDPWPLAAGEAGELTSHAARTCPGVPVIVLTHHVTPRSRQAVRRAGGYTVWPKDDVAGLVGFARHLAELRQHARDDAR